MCMLCHIIDADMLFIQGSMGLLHNLPGIHRHLAVQDHFPVLPLRVVLKLKQILDIALRPLNR